MNRPTKQDVVEYFGSPQAAGTFMGISRQGIEAWPEGEIGERQLRILLGSFTRQQKRVPDEFKVEPLRMNGA